MADKWMYIPNDDTQNYPLCRIQLVGETFKHSTQWNNQSKFPKVVKPMNKKTLYKTLGTNEHPNVPLLPANIHMSWLFHMKIVSAYLSFDGYFLFCKIM